MKEIESAKNKYWDEMTDIERRAFVEAVCIRTCDYLVKTQSSTKAFFKYWATAILTKKVVANNVRMARYYYDVIDNQPSLSIEAEEDELIDVSHCIKEVRLFVLNAINEVPFKTPIMDAALSGKKKFEIIRDGVDENEYSNAANLKAGRKVGKDSMRQRIARGEITRYEAYIKPARLRKKAVKNPQGGEK